MATKEPGPIVPTPQRLKQRSGRLRLHSGAPIVLGPEAEDSDLATAQALQQRAREIADIDLAIESHSRCDDIRPRVELLRSGAQAEGAGKAEGYRIQVDPQRAQLTGDGPAGLRYAVETFVQLLDRRGVVPACSVEDAPSLALRGIMLDVSRGKLPSLATLKQIVDFCVRFKLNALMLYVEHTFRFRRHPKIGAHTSALDSATLLELDAYAAQRHVELIPSLQSLGHMDHILNLPEYRGLAETPRGWTLAPAEPASYELLSDLYDEYLPNFRSRMFNANCDETFDLGQGRSADLDRELGPGGLFLFHVERLRKLAGAHGKRTMIWGDMVHTQPQRISEFSRDLIFLDWWYEAGFDYDRVKRFSEHGLDFIVCPGTSSWNCLFPRVQNSIENIAGYADAGRRHGAHGLLVTDWGDFGHYNPQGGSWYGYAWAAEQAWSGKASTRDFDRAFSRHAFADRSGRAARLYRELGSIHDAGFPVFNGSALQYLYFDDLDEAYFIDAARPGALRRTERRLERARQKIDAAEDSFSNDPLTWEEIRLAGEQSLLAVQKALAGAEYVAWRRKPSALKSPKRRRLAHRLVQIANQQAVTSRQLACLWLARNQRSDLDMTQRRIERSIRSLRKAARSLERNRPPDPPPAHSGIDIGGVMRAVYRSIDSN